MQKLYAFDIECYPNLFTLAAIGIDTDERFIFEWSERKDNRNELREWVKGKTLIGYNAISYDMPMLNYVIGEPTSVAGCFNLSKYIIEDVAQYKERIHHLRYEKKKYKVVDLAKALTGNGGRFPSLKQVAIHLQWGRLQDLPYPPTEKLSLEKIETVIDYNFNDVGITKALYLNIMSKVNMRRDIGVQFGIDAINASDSKIADLVFGQHIEIKRDAGTARSQVYGKSIISENVLFVTRALLDILTEIAETELMTGLSFTVVIGNTTYKVGVGGLHSEDLPGVFISDENTVIRDADVTSYYPSIALLHGYEPAHLAGQFSSVYKTMVEARVDAKESGDMTTADALKIAINGAFGKLNSKFSWLYDPKMFYAITLNGQLYLLDLIEKFELAGIEVISANTDGVICKFSIEQEDKYNEVCNEWQARTMFALEYTNYIRYIRRDVNNYVAQTNNGKIKTKGVFFTETDFKKGYNKPIVAIAAKQYFLDGTEPEVTIKGEKNIHAFMMTQSIGKDFTPVFLTTEGERETQRHNRYYAVRSGGGALMKVRKNGMGRITVCSGVHLANDIVENMPLPDYKYYIDEAWKLIRSIQPEFVQRSLFDCFGIQ